MKLSVRFLMVCIAVITVSCVAPTPYMKVTDNVLAPSESKALVRFISPKAVGFLFDSDKCIAYMVPGTQFDYLADPGKHLFIVSLENKAFLEADLEAGKTYYVLLRSYMGVWRARVAFIAVNRGSEFWDKVYAYSDKSRKIRQDPEPIRKLDEANRHKVSAAITQYEAGVKDEFAWEALHPEDGR